MASHPAQTDTDPLTKRLPDGIALLLELGVVAAPPALLLLVRYFSWGAGIYRFCALLSVLALVAWLTSRRRKLRSLFSVKQRWRWLAAGALCLIAVQARTFVHDFYNGATCTTDMGRPSICAGEWLLRGRNPWAECATPVARRNIGFGSVRSVRARSVGQAARRSAKHTGAIPSSAPAAEPLDTWTWCVDDDRCIDPKGGGSYRAWQQHGAGYRFMDGYKYGPLMALLYLPATHALIEPGIYVVNFLFWLALLLLIAALARAAYPQLPCAPFRALIGLLLPAAVPFWSALPSLKLGGGYQLSPPDPTVFLQELTTTCSNDVIPMVLVLASALLAARRHSLLAGVFCGLSLATKQLPAPLIALLLLGLPSLDWRRFLLGTVATATLIYLPFFLWSPREMIANLILFGVVRPTNSSSIRRYVPAGFEPVFSLLQLVVIAFFTWRWLRAPKRDLATLLRIAALSTIAFLALNKVVHGNYFLWVQPLIALAIAGAPFAPRLIEPAEQEAHTPAGG